MEMVKQLTLRSRASSGIMQTEFTPRLPSLRRVGFSVPSPRPAIARSCPGVVVLSPYTETVARPYPARAPHAHTPPRSVHPFFRRGFSLGKKDILRQRYPQVWVPLFFNPSFERGSRESNASGAIVAGCAPRFPIINACTIKWQSVWRRARIKIRDRETERKGGGPVSRRASYFPLGAIFPELSLVSNRVKRSSGIN